VITTEVDERTWKVICLVCSADQFVFRDNRLIISKRHLSDERDIPILLRYMLPSLPIVSSYYHRHGTRVDDDPYCQLGTYMTE
jgi:hypothetical protein